MVPDPERMRAHLRSIAGAPTFTGRMIDRRFDQQGRLGALDHVLRVRRYHREDGSVREELGWKGPTTATPDGYKSRTELESRLSGGAPVATILEALGFSVVHAIDRYVELFQIGEAVVRMEWYPDCDTLMEIEGPTAAIESAIRAVGLPRAGFTADPLVVFANAWAARQGRPARLALTSPAEVPAHWPR